MAPQTGGGRILESCDISLKITPTLPSTQSSPIYVCMQLFKFALQKAMRDI